MTDHSTTYRLNGREVSRDEFLGPVAKRRKRLDRAPGMYGDFGDFRRETDRKTGRSGRYYGQLARFPGDPTAVFHSKREALEAAKRRGLEEDRS